VFVFDWDGTSLGDTMGFHRGLILGIPWDFIGDFSWGYHGIS